MTYSSVYNGPNEQKSKVFNGDVIRYDVSVIENEQSTFGYYESLQLL